MEKRQTAENTNKESFFCIFEHSSLPTLLIKQNKNNWARNYMWHSHYFMAFLLFFHYFVQLEQERCPKTEGKGPKRLVILKNDHFS